MTMPCTMDWREMFEHAAQDAPTLSNEEQQEQIRQAQAVYHATFLYEASIGGYGPATLPTYRMAMAAELGIDGERLHFTQRAPYGFDVTLDGSPLQMTCDEQVRVGQVVAPWVVGHGYG